MDYEHTHVSIRDSSPAMFISEDDDGNYTLMNECGDTWTASQDDWISLAEVEQEHYEAWAEQEAHDYYDPMGYNSDSYINYLNRGY